MNTDAERIQVALANKADSEVVFYYLKEHTLNELELETIINCDSQLEITLKDIESDEGGNIEESEEEVVTVYNYSDNYNDYGLDEWDIK